MRSKIKYKLYWMRFIMSHRKWVWRGLWAHVSSIRLSYTRDFPIKAVEATQSRYLLPSWSFVRVCMWPSTTSAFCVSWSSRTPGIVRWIRRIPFLAWTQFCISFQNTFPWRSNNAPSTLNRILKLLWSHLWANSPYRSKNRFKNALRKDNVPNVLWVSILGQFQ